MTSGFARRRRGVRLHRAAGVLAAVLAVAPAAGAPDSGAASMTPEAEPSPPSRASTAGRRPERARDLADFGAAAPYPLAGNIIIPETNEPFFARDADGRLFHDAPRGGRLFEHPTYDDKRSLVVVPPRFDPAKPAAVVLFFHGNLAVLERDVVRRQRVVAQVAGSRLNAVLVAPQLAVDALDSSPGRFYEREFLDGYLDEAARQLAARAGGRFTAEDAGRWPVILVAYSGGYLATAYCLPAQSGSRRRILGVVLLDALFGEEAKFAAWIAQARDTAFLVSAFSPSSAGLNGRLAADLAAHGVPVAPVLPAAMKAGAVVLRAAPGAEHNGFVTMAWTRDPLQDVLSRVDLGGGEP